MLLVCLWNLLRLQGPEPVEPNSSLRLSVAQRGSVCWLLAGYGCKHCRQTKLLPRTSALHMLHSKARPESADNAQDGDADLWKTHMLRKAGTAHTSPLSLHVPGLPHLAVAGQAGSEHLCAECHLPLPRIDRMSRLAWPVEFLLAEVCSNSSFTYFPNPHPRHPSNHIPALAWGAGRPWRRRGCCGLCAMQGFGQELEFIVLEKESRLGITKSCTDQNSDFHCSVHQKSLILMARPQRSPQNQQTARSQTTSSFFLMYPLSVSLTHLSHLEASFYAGT